MLTPIPICTSVKHINCTHSYSPTSPHLQVAAALEHVRNATSHTECSSALGALQLLASTRQGASALALCDWQGALDTLLTSSPATPEDHRLWCMLLPLVRISCGPFFAPSLVSSCEPVCAATLEAHGLYCLLLPFPFAPFVSLFWPLLRITGCGACRCPWCVLFLIFFSAFSFHLD